jgi:hypothetical protein
MLISKTEKGQTALQQRCSQLKGRDRQMLIVVDGRRTDQEVLAFFGKESADALARLEQGGYIERFAAKSRVEGAAGEALARNSIQVDIPCQSSNPSRSFADSSGSNFGHSVPGSSKLGQSSMSQARRYLVNRLSELKDRNAKRFISSLERCVDSNELITAMLHTLMYFQSELASSDCSDIALHMSKTVPPKYWDRIKGDLALTPDSCC